MINQLRRRMIRISSMAVILVFALIFAAIFVLSERQLDNRMDQVTDRISDGNGLFLPFDQDNPIPISQVGMPDFFTEETPFSTRFFVVWLDDEQSVTGVDLDAVTSVTEETAQSYAQQVIRDGALRGWTDHFRYKVFSTEDAQGIIFVDGSMNRAMTRTLLLTAAVVLIGSLLVILAVIVVVSRRAVRPLALSYEKQKQFITDASHELKTPLTLILTNVDIVEQELGSSEWLDDIRIEGERMSGLIGQLTALSRLDEDVPIAEKREFSLSEICEDMISEFTPLVEEKGLQLTASIASQVSLIGDEAALRQLVSTLMDNAVKYCDPGGGIEIRLEKKRQAVLTVENDYIDVDSLELDRLCDRFYRADKARTAGTGFGVGLSLASSIAQTYKGEVQPYRAGDGRIGFRVRLK